MAWTDPTTRSTGALISASIYNADLINNLKWLRNSGGKAQITTTEVRSNTAYGTLTTADQVTGVVLPTDGLIAIAYQATWQESVNAAARAAIFIGSNQLQVASVTTSAPAVQECANGGGSGGNDKPLFTSSTGLQSGPTNATGYGGDVTTGQIVGAVTGNAPGGGPVFVFAAAGTYTISVQFKASSGSVTVKNRHLWVWVRAFA